MSLLASVIAECQRELERLGVYLGCDVLCVITSCVIYILTGQYSWEFGMLGVKA